MRFRLTAFILALVVATIVPAASIPSTATGDYVGDGWSCRLLAYQHPDGPIGTVLELQCTDAESVQRQGLVTHWGCPFLGHANRLYPWWTNPLTAPPDVYMSIVEAGPSGLVALVDGQPIQLWRVQALPSPAPYTCASVPSPFPAVDQRQLDLVCRVLPTAPSCRR